LARLENWAAASDLGWIVFASCSGFLLADGSVRSSDASVVRLERWQALGEVEREGFPPLGPDLVVELASPVDYQFAPFRPNWKRSVKTARNL